MNDSGMSHSTEGVAAIADALRFHPSLTQLDMSFNELCGLNSRGEGTHTVEAIQAIANVLVDGSLMALSLAGVDLQLEGLNVICTAIQSNKATKLSSLDISFGRFGPLGAKSVADMVVRSRSLTSLSLRNSRMGPEGAGALAPALIQGSLALLDVSDNNLCEHRPDVPHVHMWDQQERRHAVAKVCTHQCK